MNHYSVILQQQELIKKAVDQNKLLAEEISKLISEAKYRKDRRLFTLNELLHLRAQLKKRKEVAVENNRVLEGSLEELIKYLTIALEEGISPFKGGMS